MLQLRQLDLQFALPGAGALGEDVENQRRPVEHFALEHLLQVPVLCRRQFVVENDRINVLSPAVPRKFVRLAAADEGRGFRSLESLSAVADDRRPRGHRQFGQFIQGLAHLPARA